MDLFFQNRIQVRVLEPDPRHVIWYAGIPALIQALITRQIFDTDNYHTSLGMVNELFKKEDFAFALLSREEINQINRFKALKKQIEWMAGRFLAKQMLAHFFFAGTPLDCISLDYLEQGAPFCVQKPGLNFSLSHSGTYTACALARQPGTRPGVDLEKISAAPDTAFLTTAFTPEENRHMGNDPARIFTGWTLKEAFLKYIRKGFNESLQQVEVLPGGIFHRGRKAAVDTFSTRIGETYILSMVTGPG